MYFDGKDLTEESTYEPVVWAASGTGDRRVTVVQDSGRRDGIPKVLFGIGRSTSSNERALSRRRGGKKKAAAEKRTLIHWLQKLLLLDAVSWTGRGRVFQLPLTR